MADKVETKKNTKKEPMTKKPEKKIATGSTKKIVQSRSSSVAGKKGTTRKASTSKTTKKVEKEALDSPKTAKRTTTTKSEKVSKTKTTKKEENETKTKKATTKKEEKQPKKATTKSKKAETKSTTKKEKTAKHSDTQKSKYSMDIDEIMKIKEMLEEKKNEEGTEENKIEVPTIEELLKKMETSETEDIIKMKNTPKPEELLDIEEEEDIDNEEPEEVEEEADEELEEDDEEEEEEKPKTRIQKRKAAEIQEAVRKEMKKNKQVSEEELSKIHSRVFQNICLAVAIMVYLNFVILGFVNIENAVFTTDLKVFSIALLIIAVGIFEYAYKKDSGRHAIQGIEILFLALTTMALIYVNLMWKNKFVQIVTLVAMIFAIYYVAKSIIIYTKMKKQYFINTMKEMIKKK